MATYLTGWAGGLSSYMTPHKPTVTKQLPSPPPGDQDFDSRLDRRSQSPILTTNDAWLSSTKTVVLDTLEQSTPVRQRATSKKRARDASANKTKKRRKTGEASPGFSDYEADSDLEGSTLITSPDQSSKAQGVLNPKPTDLEDRAKMPPPIRPAPSNYSPPRLLVDKDLNRSHKIVRLDVEDPDDSDEELLTAGNTVKKTDRREVAPDFNHERARRYADAVILPKDSGHWSESEKDLFFRLAMRGFEPLVPGNWTIDFKTLPESLFSAQEGDKPFIEPYSVRQFRAIYYLGVLFSTGIRVRDRGTMSLRAEPTIRKILRQYVSWALYDAQLHLTQRPKTIPIHCIKTMRKRETTQKALDRLTRKLHNLATRFHDLHGIHPSVEKNDTDIDGDNETTDDDDIRFPILTGFLICSSVILVITLDTNPSRFRPLPPPTPSGPEPPQSQRVNNISKEESGLRFIATFDFSEDGMDVWNALAIAIVVMRIRKTMRQMMENAGNGAEMWEMVNATPKQRPGKEGKRAGTEEDL